MSKKVYAGADIIFNYSYASYPMTINTAEDLGIDSYRIQLSNLSNPAEKTHIMSYMNSISDKGNAYPKFGAANGSDTNATHPISIPPHKPVSVQLYYSKFYIIDSIDADIPDILYDLLFFNSPDGYESAMSTKINTDGNKQDVVSVSVHAHTADTITIYPTTIVESNGLNDDTV